MRDDEAVRVVEPSLVAVSRTEDARRIYMNMATGGVGMSLGLGGFETQVAILFKDVWDFDEFVAMGYDATAEAGSMFGDEKAEIGVRFVDGRAIFESAIAAVKTGTFGGSTGSALQAVG